VKRRAAAALGASCLLLACVRAAFPHAQPTTTVQFDREIVHILDDHCVMCHTPGGPAFPLVTYEQTYAARWKIRQDALNRHMAPWGAVAGYGVFANDNGLTQREIDFLSSWAESYGPRNNGQVYTGIAAAAPQVVQAHFDFSRWLLGNPDLRLALPPATLAPRQAAAIQHATLDPKLTADRWLRGLEYKPGDRRVVHAVSFSIQETGQWLGSWTPWHPFVSLPPGLAYRLPAGSHIAADIRYYGAADPVVEHGSLALYFASATAAPRAVINLTLEAQGPATASGGSRKLLAAMTLEQDTNILALQPQILPGVQSIEVAVRKPDGATQILLFARDIPLDWPTPYVLAKPVPLLKGTRLSVIEHYPVGAALPAGGLALTLSACPGTALAPGRLPPAPAPPPSPAQHFKLTGTVKSVDAGSGRVLVQHGDIPGFMGAMTMFYSVAKEADLKRLTAGDEIQSDVVTGGATGPALENIKVVKKAH
jgi:Cu/Ag efflux protein CusF